MRYVPTLETNAYDVTETYRVGTTITYNGIVYQSVQDVPANTPITNTNYWLPISNAANVPGLITTIRDTATEISNFITAASGISIDKVTTHDYGKIRLLDIKFTPSTQIASGTNITIGTVASNQKPIDQGFGCRQTVLAQINSGNGNVAIRTVGASMAANTQQGINLIMMMP